MKAEELIVKGLDGETYGYYGFNLDRKPVKGVILDAEKGPGKEFVTKEGTFGAYNLWYEESLAEAEKQYNQLILDEMAYQKQEYKRKQAELKQQMIQNNQRRRLLVTCTCEAVYESSIEVPAHMSLKEALNYAERHIDRIHVGEMNYLSGTDQLDRENSHFEDDGEDEE